MSAILEQKVGELETKFQEMQERLDEFEKSTKDNQKEEKHDLEEMIIKRKEFNEKMAGLLDWKEGIDEIIEKIKKILPI